MPNIYSDPCPECGGQDVPYGHCGTCDTPPVNRQYFTGSRAGSPIIKEGPWAGYTLADMHAVTAVDDLDDPFAD